MFLTQLYAASQPRTLATGTSRKSDEGQHDGTIYLWDVSTRAIREVLYGHTDEVFSLAFSRDGMALASSSRDGIVRLWDPHTGQERANLYGHKEWIYCVAFSHDSSYLASAGHDGEINLWNEKRKLPFSQIATHKTSAIYCNRVQ